jgi:phytanoyl-CoA hydroxylase
MTRAGLDPAQVAHYWDHGWVVVPGLFEKADLERWSQRFEDIVETRTPAAKRMLVMRDVMVAKGAVTPKTSLEAIAKIQDFENDPVLDAYNQHPALIDCVESILGPDLQSIHCMLINKPPGVDGRHPLHQDLVYFPFRPADAVVATWTALQRVTRENGCLVVVSGSQRGPLLEHQNVEWEYVNAGYFGAKGAGAHLERVHVECEPGDTILFHSLILHGSGQNRTQGFRRAISCHYASTQCEKLYDEQEHDPTRWYRHLRGRPPSAKAPPKDALRPGQPGYVLPRGSRRAT